MAATSTPNTSLSAATSAYCTTEGSGGCVRRFSLDMGWSFMLMRCEAMARADGEYLAATFDVLLPPLAGAQKALGSAEGGAVAPVKVGGQKGPDLAGTGADASTAGDEAMPSPPVSEVDFGHDEPMEEQQQQTSAPSMPKSATPPNPHVDNIDAAGSALKVPGSTGGVG